MRVKQPFPAASKRSTFGFARDLVLVAPIVLVIGFFIVLPTASVVIHSFTNWNPGYGSPWVGLRNYGSLLHSPTFHEVLINHAVLLIGLPLWVIAPLLVAALLYDGVPAAGLFRTIVFFPAVVSPAAIGILFASFLAPAGPLNQVLRSVRLGSLARNWLVDASVVKPALIIIICWFTLGVGVVIFSAALSAIPPELFEAAEMDGARWLQRFWHVIVPGLKRTIELWTVILVISAFVAFFPWIFTLTGGGPGYASTTIDFDIYQNALTKGFFGLAAAEAVVMLLIVAVVLGVGAVVFSRARESS
jgi:ABC-type sugar transport system permease subunit